MKSEGQPANNRMKSEDDDPHKQEKRTFPFSLGNVRFHFAKIACGCAAITLRRAWWPR